jgi:hypothetical protein
VFLRFGRSGILAKFGLWGGSALLATAAIAPLLAQLDPAGDKTFNHVLFFDVSGSMTKTLGGAGSPARRYLAEHLFGPPWMLREGQPLSVYSFTVKCRPEFSGKVDYSNLRNMLQNGLPITHENTDLVETMRKAEAEYARDTHGGITLAWVLTDNVNDPAGNGSDEVNTRKFYGEMFREDTGAQRMYFFPLKDYKLVLYLLVFAPDATVRGIDMDRFEDAVAGFARSLGAPKVRAKPVGGENPLEFSFTTNEAGPVAEVIGTGRKSSLVIRGLKEGQPLSGRFQLRVRSRFDEWRVEHANVETTRLEDLKSDDFPNVAGNTSAHLSPSTVTVDPRATSDVVYTLDLGEGQDQIPRASFFKLAALNPDGYGVVSGKLVMKIGDPEIKLKFLDDPATTEAVHSIFNLENVEYFVPKAVANKEIRLDFAIPVRFEVGYDYVPRWLTLAGILILAAGTSIWLLTGGHRPVQCRLIGYQEEPFTLTSNAAFRIAPSGKPIAEMRKGLFGGIECRPRPGVTVNKKHGPVSVVNGGAVELVSEDVIYSYCLEILSTARAAAAAPGANPPGGGYY